MHGSFVVHFHLVTEYSLYLANYNPNFASFAQTPFLNLQLQNKQNEEFYYDKPHPQKLAKLKCKV
jgi:hypothetical protein